MSEKTRVRVVQWMKRSRAETGRLPKASQPLARLIDEHSGKHRFELSVISRGFISILLCSSYSSSFPCMLLAGGWVIMVLLLVTLGLHSSPWAFGLSSKLLLLSDFVYHCCSLLGCNKYLRSVWADSAVRKVRRAPYFSLLPNFTPKSVAKPKLGLHVK